jgi:hypothetical protein
MFALRLFPKPEIRIHLVLISALFFAASVTRADLVATDTVTDHASFDSAPPASGGAVSAVSSSPLSLPWEVRGGLLLLPILAFKHFRRHRKNSDL